MEIVPLKGGQFNELMLCNVDGLDVPLGFEMKCKVEGLNVEYELLDSNDPGTVLASTKTHKNLEGT